MFPHHIETSQLICKSIDWFLYDGGTLVVNRLTDSTKINYLFVTNGVTKTA